MAAYEVLSQEPTLQVLSPEIVIDADRVIARALASGVVFAIFVANYTPTAIDRFETQAQRIARALSGWAATWDANAAVPGVLNIGMSQEVDAAGQLRDVALVFASSSSGRSVTQLTLGPARWETQEFKADVAAARASLDAVEATGPPVSQSGVTAEGVVVDVGAAG